MPSSADVMKLAIADISNSSLDAGAVSRALEELLVLVEPIDNANGGGGEGRVKNNGNDSNSNQR